MDMSIAALSVDMNLAKTQQDFGVAVMKMAMEADTSILEETLETVARKQYRHHGVKDLIFA